MSGRKAVVVAVGGAAALDPDDAAAREPRRETPPGAATCRCPPRPRRTPPARGRPPRASKLPRSRSSSRSRPTNARLPAPAERRRPRAAAGRARHARRSVSASPMRSSRGRSTHQGSTRCATAGDTRISPAPAWPSRRSGSASVSPTGSSSRPGRAPRCRRARCRRAPPCGAPGGRCARVRIASRRRAAGSPAPPARRAAGAARARAGRRTPPSGATAMRATTTRSNPATRSAIFVSQRCSSGPRLDGVVRHHQIDGEDRHRSLLPARLRRRWRPPAPRPREVPRAGAAAGSSTGRPLDAEAAHAMAEGVAPEAEQPRRAHDVAARPRQRGADASAASSAGRPRRGDLGSVDAGGPRAAPAAARARRGRSSRVVAGAASRAPSDGSARARCPASRTPPSHARAASSSRFGSTPCAAACEARKCSASARRRRPARAAAAPRG